MTSIWLLPEGRQEQRLQELINRLAEEHATVAFAPHLTVLPFPGAQQQPQLLLAPDEGCIRRT